MNGTQAKQGDSLLSPEDEQRPVVGFLRLCGWSEERIADVVAAHKRGDTYTATVTLRGTKGV